MSFRAPIAAFGMMLAWSVGTPPASQGQQRIVPALWGPGPDAHAGYRRISRYQDNLDYVIDRRAHPQFAPIGELESIETWKDERDVENHYYGTGFLISPCYIATNNHVVVDSGIQSDGKDHSMIFRIGLSNNPSTAFLGSTKATPIYWGRLGAAATNDWAILKLKTCVGARPDIGWTRISRIIGKDIVGREVAVAGFAGDRNRGVLSFGIGRAVGIDRANGMIKHSVSTGGGQSGSPLMMRDSDGLTVVGIDTLEFTEKSTGKNNFATYTDRYGNEATDIASVWSFRRDIQLLIEQDIRENGRGGNAAERFMTADWPRPIRDSSKL